LRLHQSDQSATNGESAFRAAYVWRQKHHGGVRHSVAVERPVASEDAGARVASTDRKRAAEAGVSLTTMLDAALRSADAGLPEL
jgi:hypothetical protein